MTTPLQPAAPIKPDQILEIILRRKWLIVIPLCLTITLGFILVFLSNRTYQASTMILVQPQRLPKEYVKSIVTSTIGQRVGTISQQILSRSNLEKTIEQFGLFEDKSGMYLEDKIQILKDRIRVKIEKTREGSDAFSISYTGEEPQRVMRITNTLASFFMDENLKVRESQAIGTSEFLDSELMKTKKKLEEFETNLSEYRARYMGGLPEELTSNLRTLDRLQQQIYNKQTILWEAKNLLTSTEAQIALETSQIQKLDNAMQEAFGSIEPQAKPAISENEQLLQIAVKEYENLLTQYTEKHPDVRRLKKRIEKLKQSVEEQSEDSGTAHSISSIQSTQPAIELAGNQRQEIEQLLMQKKFKISEIKNEIKKTESEISLFEKQMKFYQKKVADTPKREMELQALQRDYLNIQDIYNSLLDRKLEAELSVNMEKKQKGEQFRILDHARLPQKPLTPSIAKFFLFSVALGLMLGAGTTFLLEFADSSIKTNDQIETDLGLTILASIPPLEDKNGYFKNKIDIMGIIIAVCYLGVVIACFAVLHVKGIDRTLNYIKSFIG